MLIAALPVKLICGMIDILESVPDDYRWMGAQPLKNAPALFAADSGERVHDRAYCVRVRFLVDDGREYQRRRATLELA
jgi:hypothetical protein